MPIVSVGIEIARFHGINLHHGVKNLANGDCVIEAMADNITIRDCFFEVYNQSAAFNRKMWLTEAAKVVFEYSGISKEEFDLEWEQLKQPYCYECPLGDFVLPAIAHCTRKDVLIFNTSLKGSWDPIYVVQSSEMGNRQANTEIPVLLAYDGVHYEGLVPDTLEDQEKTVILKKTYLSGDYAVQKKDIPVFQVEKKGTTVKDTYSSIVKDTMKLKTETMTHISKSVVNNQLTKKAAADTIDQGQKECFQMKTKRVKDMSKDELKEYNRIKKKESRDKANNPVVSNAGNDNSQENDPWKLVTYGKRKKIADMSVSELRIYNKIKKMESRAAQRIEDPIAFKQKRATEKADERVAKRLANESLFKQTRTIESAKIRNTQRASNAIAFKQKRNTEKAKERLAQRIDNDSAFKQKRAIEKAKEREAQRMENDIAFKQKRAMEKAEERKAQRMENDIKFKQKRATEKAKERAAQRMENDSAFKQKRAKEKAKEREAQRMENDIAFKEKRATEKAEERAAQRMENDVAFKQKRTAEIAKQRKAQRSENEIAFKQKRATEKAKERIKSTDSEEKRRRKFLESVRQGRIFECVSCHRKLFENGVDTISDKLRNEFRNELKDIFEAAIGSFGETKTIEGVHHICHTCKGYIVKGKCHPFHTRMVFNYSMFRCMKN